LRLEASAYYTTDLEDAINTAIDMIARATTAHLAADAARRM